MTRTDSSYGQAAALGAVLLLCISATAPSGCSQSVLIGEDAPSDGGVPTFLVPDAATADASQGLTEYCPSNKCPSGYTTCSGSRFPCDVNLMTDRNNCGECGFACPAATSREWYECVDGHCLLMCTNGTTLDCDGFPDNGCESSFNSNDSCGGCGITCTDPAKPCIRRSTAAGDFGCGCKDEKMLCSRQCVNPKTDDANCSNCGNVCPSDGGPTLEPALHMYYGCVDGECGNRKCRVNWGDCDGNRDNGCESDLLTTQNCGACGNACPAGQECRMDVKSGPQCMCPEGTTFCPAFTMADIVFGECVDTASDETNCGGCGMWCHRWEATHNSLCVNGACKLECVPGKADCNGDPTDGCEVTIDSDPRNCGGCKIVCDAIAGQACVGGKCVVEPCDQVGPDAGVVAK